MHACPCPCLGCRSPRRSAAVLERHGLQSGDHRLRGQSRGRGRRRLRARGRPDRGVRQRRNPLEREAALFPGSLRARRAAREGRGRSVDPDLRSAEGRCRWRHEGRHGRRNEGARRHHQHLAFGDDRRRVRSRHARVADHRDQPGDGHGLCGNDLPADGRTAELPTGRRLHHLHRVRGRGGFHPLDFRGSLWNSDLAGGRQRRQDPLRGQGRRAVADEGRRRQLRRRPRGQAGRHRTLHRPAPDPSPPAIPTAISRCWNGRLRARGRASAC